MKLPGRHRQYVATRSGRRLCVCGLRRLPSRLPDPAVTERTPSVAFAWFSSATLLLVVFFSVYAAVRPPQLPDDPRRKPPISALARYSFEDFLNSAR